MSRDDHLPTDWYARSLADPALAGELLDAIVTPADRSRGGVSLLLCRGDGRLAQPVFVEGAHDEGAQRETISAIALNCVSMPGVGGLVVAMVRPWGVSITDADRRVHQHAIDVCRRAPLDLHGTFVVTKGGIVALPVAPELVGRWDVA